MSASPSPPNPGQPRKGPTTPQPTNLARFGPRILLGGVLLGVTYTYFATRVPKPHGTPVSNPFKTPGVKNIEEAYQSGGATSTHTKAYGGTPLGQKDDLARGGQFGTGKERGFEEEYIGEAQRPTQPNKVGEKFNEMKYGDPKGK
jgi:hypothetical protein